jgi:hypothetical protein
MQAKDLPPKKGEEGLGPQSRMDAAKEAVRDLIRKKRRNDWVMLVRMDSQITPVTSWTTDSALLDRALNNLEPAETAADIGRGLRFAADTLREVKQPMLVLVGDGHYDPDQLRCVFWGRQPPPDFQCETPPADAAAAPKGQPAAGMAPDPMAPDAMAPDPMAPDPMAPVAGMAPDPMAPVAGMAPDPMAAVAGMAPDPMAADPDAGRMKAPEPEVVAAERFIDAIALGDVPVHGILVGRTGNNVGIISFNARRNPTDKFSYQLFVKVRNYTNQAKRVNLLVSSGAVLPETVPLELGPGETKQYLKKGLPAAGAMMTGKLSPASGSGTLDDFALDDTAYALLPKRRKTSVLLVSEGNLYLEGTLLLDDHVTYQKVLPAAYTEDLARKHDAVIFDDFNPPSLPKTGAFILFDPRGEASPIKIARRVPDPEIWWPQSEKDKRHPIMDFITVKDLRTLEASVFSLEPKDVPLIRLDERGDVYAALRQVPGRKVVVVGFSTRQTNWVMRVGFPVFVLNTLAYFAGENTRLIQAYRTGETWTVPLEIAGETVEVQDPRGKKYTVPLKDGELSFYGRHIGFHTITTLSGQTLHLAANLANPDESDITPQTKVTLGHGRHGRELTAPNLKADTPAARISTRSVILTVILAGIGLVLLGFGLSGSRAGVLFAFLGVLLLGAAVVVIAFALDLRPWTGLLLAVLIALLAEWLTYNRRVTV